jgi:hypothetical protein
MPHGDCGHCRRGPRQLFPRGLCKRCYYTPAVRALHPSKYPDRRDWTAAERANLKAWRAAGVPIDECARRLGRKRGQVVMAIVRWKLTRPRRKPGELAAAVRRLHAKGLTDEAIGLRLGLARPTIQRTRARLGLPRATDPVECARRGWRAAIEAHGCHPLTAHIRSLSDGFVRLGWPSGITPALLDTLQRFEAAGPAGATPRALGLRNVTAWRRVTDALAAGLLVAVGRRTIRGQRYTLAPAVAEVRRRWHTEQKEPA